MDAKRREIREHLDTIKELVRWQAWHCDPRNDGDLDVMGITRADIRDMLLALKVEDYCEGPDPDRDPRRPGDVWLYAIDVPGSAVLKMYAKLKTDPKKIHLTVISFHQERFPLRKFLS